AKGAARASRAMARQWRMSRPVGQWRIEYDLKHGTADIFHDGILLISHAVAVARVPQSVTSRDYKSRKAYRRPIHDGFGDGVEYVVASSGGGTGTMTQRFWLYNNADFFLTDVTINRKGGVASNYMSPLCAENESSFLPDGDNRALFVPFDNDKWIRYNAVPFGSAVTSYEVSAFYNNATRYGLVIGSVEHDVWKTGIQSVTTANGLAAIEVFGGIASPLTRDVLPHGKASGQTVRSPKIFVGWYSDWRDGLDAYAKANATVAPRRAWSGGPPFGWNSWGKLQFRLTFDKAIQVSDFFAKKLPSFKDDRVAYIGLDAGWNIFSDQQLKQFVAHCQSNGQQAGIYFTPFAAWGAHDDALIPGTQYHYRDIYAYANGRRESIAGGVALDPTHPGTQALIASAIAEFKKAGFTYVKADFLTQGALEADKYFDPRVTTGIEAYNEGMRFVDRQLGPGIFLNESIAPLFPARYANSRRIACDSFGSIAQVEYTLNSVTYGWWLARVYDFNDPDEMVLDGYTENENRARVTSAAITGNFISGDDFSDDGSAAGKERAEKFLANDEINKVARMRQKFRPVEGNTGPRAANLFYLEDGNNCYIAAFNYSQDPANWTLNLKRIGINAGNGSCATNLWNGTVQRMTNGLDIGLGPADATIYKFAIRGGFIHDGRDPHSSGHRHLP
ncbi:MAG: alpha-galactosidase, partial [Limisphaerales bacterium]